ncbi:MAG: CDP-alcohol phosphatidyltransferase family protein [Oculatellaceae cyanobacterium Prado106]|jgi:CDP-diacylglycerol--glycerol-3-phosphate 3-phosphatidyltransferase|nr:CDP-alcohol phosphatidyltransferase family protein [Oculatellaceae cyanobacterium Prado106]
MLRHLPLSLVILRFAIAPLLLLDALDHQASAWFLVTYGVAIVSDIFDGIIARRLGVSTPTLRQADSWADVTLFVCLAISTGLIYPEVLVAFRVPLAIALVAQLSLYLLCLIKFGKAPSFHTYTAKAWGLMLLVAVIALYGWGASQWLWGAIAFCWVNSVEEILIALRLQTWQCDILSLWHVNQALEQE